MTTRQTPDAVRKLHVALLDCPHCGSRPERRTRRKQKVVRCHAGSHLLEAIADSQREADDIWNAMAADWARKNTREGQAATSIQVLNAIANIQHIAGVVVNGSLNTHAHQLRECARILSAALDSRAGDAEQRNSHDDAQVYGIGVEVDGIAIHPGRVVIRNRHRAGDAGEVKITGADIWESLFAIYKQDVPEQITDEVCVQLADRLQWSTSSKGSVYAALQAQEDAEDARADCECEGGGQWEHCGPCSLRFGRAIDLRRAALSATPAPAVDAWAMVNRLRDQEADSVEIFCDNPEGTPNNAITCCGFWTGFVERRFEGDTIIAALQSAVAAKDQADRDGHPPMSPAVDAVPAGEVDTFGGVPVAAIHAQMKAVEDEAARTLWIGAPLLKGLTGYIRAALSHGEGR